VNSNMELISDLHEAAPVTAYDTTLAGRTAAGWGEEVRPPATIWRYRRIILACVGILFLALATFRALNDRPGCDEGWFASPALNLATKGHFGTTVIEEANLKMTTGIHQFTYWIMPLNPLVQAAWYKLVGFGLFQMRTVSVIFGVVALVALYKLLKGLVWDLNVVILALILIAVDFPFIRSAAAGRMDMMSAALNFSTLALYLHLSKRDLNLALLAAHSLVVLSILTHPNGVLGLVGLLSLIFYLDFRKIRWRHIFVSAVPYLVGAGCYGLYISRNSQAFYVQLSGNGEGRLWGVIAPWRALKSEITERYLGLGSAGPHYLKLSIFLAYALGIVAAACISEIRRNKGCRVLLIITALFFCYFTLLEGTKLYLYLVHITPLYAVITAFCARWCWVNHPKARPALAAAVCCLALANLCGTGYAILRDSYHRDYLPVVSYLNGHASEDSLIMGSSELHFGLKHKDTLLDDKYLGYRSGRVADLIVVDPRYEWERGVERVKHPEIYQHIVQLLARDYQLVYEHAAYKVYAARKP